MKNTMRWFYLFTAVTLFSSRATEAAMITYDFEATVTSVADYSSGHTLIPASIHVGSIESGSFSFDDTAPGSPYVRGTALNLTATVGISDAGEQSYYYIGATITSLQPASVPEPASLALFGSGIACLVGYRGWRRRKAAKV